MREEKFPQVEGECQMSHQLLKLLGEVVPVLLGPEHGLHLPDQEQLPYLPHQVTQAHCSQVIYAIQCIRSAEGI